MSLSKHHFIILFILFHLSLEGSSQDKPPVDFETLKKWEFVGDGSISNDGKYVCYSIISESSKNKKFVVQSTESEWRKEYFIANTAVFSGDSKFIIYKKGFDSLGVFNLTSNSSLFITDVTEFKISNTSSSCWLAYKQSTAKDELKIKNLNTGELQSHPSVISYVFGTVSDKIILETRDEPHSLKVLELASRRLKVLWLKDTLDHIQIRYSMDNFDKNVSFTIEKYPESKRICELWYFSYELDSAVKVYEGECKIDNQVFKLVNTPPEFNERGDVVFFFLEPVIKSNPEKEEIGDVWTYKDAELSTVPIRRGKGYVRAALNLKDKRVTLIQRNGELIVGLSNDFVLTKTELNDYSQFEAYWNNYVRSNYYLVSVKEGWRKLIRDSISINAERVGLSPTGKWMIYFDTAAKNYFSYEVTTGMARNITVLCHTNFISEENDMPEPRLTWLPTQNSWIKDDDALLITDNTDIWLIDPSVKLPPMNLTNGLGRTQGLKFEVLDHSKLHQQSRKKNSYVVLKAFNNVTKERGFYLIHLDKKNPPELLTMGKCIYGWWNGHDTYNNPPLRAKLSSSYLVVRMSTNDAPNYFFTKNFKDFKRISNSQPQKKYNWYTTELCEWISLDGRKVQGLLYKPENFDSTKKYPIIFSVYEQRSDEMNYFIQPKASVGPINVSLFVSSGYLVFVPDIHYKNGQPGQSAYNSVISAVDYLSRKNYVNIKAMGIQGHSFGGFETNYIITRSDVFSAACSASGVSNLISVYGCGFRGGFPMHWAEKGQGRMNIMPWQNADKYVENSPVLHAQNVSTPLLIMHNKHDRAVPFEQSFEFFVTLRRLKKKVWMLQYKDQGHSLDDGEVSDDFHLKMVDFFDHYLKGKPAAYWLQ